MRWLCSRPPSWQDARRSGWSSSPRCGATRPPGGAVLSSSLDSTIVPLDVAQRVVFNAEEVAMVNLRANNPLVGRTSVIPKTGFYS